MKKYHALNEAPQIIAETEQQPPAGAYIPPRAPESSPGPAQPGNNPKRDRWFEVITKWGGLLVAAALIPPVTMCSEAACLRIAANGPISAALVGAASAGSLITVFVIRLFGRN